MLNSVPQILINVEVIFKEQSPENKAHIYTSIAQFLMCFLLLSRIGSIHKELFLKTVMKRC